jgi:hypothetical protein
MQRFSNRTTAPFLPDTSSTGGSGPGLIWSGSSHVHGLRLPTFATGIYDLGAGEANQDSYSVPAVISILEKSARKMASHEPDRYPLEDKPAIHAGAASVNDHLGFRIGINDISMAGGGMVREHIRANGAIVTYGNWDISVIERAPNLRDKIELAHSTHQDGLDIDLRFVSKLKTATVDDIEMTKREEKVIDFSKNPEDFDYDETLEMLKAINGAAGESGYKITKLFAGDDNGPFPTIANKPFSAYCVAVGLAEGGSCSRTLEPHRHHMHLRLEPVNGVSYALDMQDRETTLTIPSGASSTEKSFSFDVIDNYERPAITYSRLNYFVLNENGTINSANDNGVLAASTAYDNILLINPTNEEGSIGKAAVILTCKSASPAVQKIVITGHPEPADPVSGAIGTINVNCKASQ